MANDKPFEYLRAAAEKFGNFWIQDEFREFVEHIDDAALSSLRAAYAAIEQREDTDRLSRWLDEIRDSGTKSSYQDIKLAQRIGQMLVLFAYLGDQGITPFSSHRVEYVEKLLEPVWTNVPKELSYLIPVTQDYGIFENEQLMLDFLENASDADMEILASTAEQIRLNGHLPVIEEWMQRAPFAQHRESWMVYCLLGVLDHAGLLE